MAEADAPPARHAPSGSTEPPGSEGAPASSGYQIHPTPAVWRQLGIKILPPRVRPINENDNPFNVPKLVKWLARHQDGFYYLGNLNPNAPAYKSMLLQDVSSPNKNYVKKCINGWERNWTKPDSEFGQWQTTGPRYRPYWGTVPPEIRFSVLNDPLTEFILPNETYFPRLCGYEIFRAPGQPLDEQPEQVGLYYDYLNGKSLRNLLEVLSNPNCRQPLPESFIWHVMAELGLAVESLLTGRSRGGIMELGRVSAHMMHPEHPSVLTAGWVPIVHRNITLDNVHLHFPYPSGDPSVSKGEAKIMFPWVVLCNFSEANTIKDHKRRWNLSRGIYARLNNREGGPFTGRKPMWAEDIYALGVIFRKLVSFLDGVRDTGSLDYDVNDYPMQRYNADATTLSHPRPTEGRWYYSGDLIEELEEWETGWNGVLMLEDEPRTWTGLMRRWPNRLMSFGAFCGIAERAFEKIFANGGYLHDGYGERTIQQLRELFRDQVETNVQQARVPMDFENMPWSPRSRAQDAGIQEIKTEMAYHRGTYQPIWLEWSSTISVTRVPGEYRRLFGPPFLCGTRPTRLRGDRGDCDCDCVEDCICGCHPTGAPSRVPSPPLHNDGEDSEERGAEDNGDRDERRGVRRDSPALSEVYSPSELMENDMRAYSQGQRRGPESLRSYSPVPFDPSSPDYTPRAPPNPPALDFEIFEDEDEELDPSTVDGGTPRAQPRLPLPTNTNSPEEMNMENITPFARGVSWAREDGRDLRSSPGSGWGGGGGGPSGGGGGGGDGGRRPFDDSDDSDGDGGDGGGRGTRGQGPLGDGRADFEIFEDAEDPTPEELLALADGTLNLLDAQNYNPARWSSSFSQGAASARNHGVVRAAQTLDAAVAADEAANSSSAAGDTSATTIIEGAHEGR